MSEEAKQGKAPDGEGGTAAKEKGEVEGRGIEYLYSCWNGGHLNWVPAHWGWFNCGYCGAFNWT